MARSIQHDVTEQTTAEAACRAIYLQACEFGSRNLTAAAIQLKDVAIENSTRDLSALFVLLLIVINHQCIPNPSLGYSCA